VHGDYKVVLDLNYTAVNGAAVESQSNQVITYTVYIIHKYTTVILKLLCLMYRQNTGFYMLCQRGWNKKKYISMNNINNNNISIYLYL